MTKVHMHDPTNFPNIYFSKKKVQHNFCSFRFKVSIHKVFHEHIALQKLDCEVTLVIDFHVNTL